MSENGIRVTATVVTLLGVSTAAYFLLVISSRTWVTNVLLVVALTAVALAAVTTWKPQLLFSSEIRGTAKRAASEEDTRSAAGTIPPSDRFKADLAKLAADVETLRLSVVTMSTTLQNSRGVPDKLERLTQVVETGFATTQRDLRDIVGRLQTTSATHAVPADPREPMPPARKAAPTTVENNDPAADVNDVLEALAQKCMGRGLSMRRVQDEIPSNWIVDSLDSSDIPDAFLVQVSKDETWVVPNTRDWLPFRERGWFDVEGLDAVNARIMAVRRLPVLGRSRNVVRRGSVEVAVQ